MLWNAFGCCGISLQNIKIFLAFDIFVFESFFFSQQRASIENCFISVSFFRERFPHIGQRAHGCFEHRHGHHTSMEQAAASDNFSLRIVLIFIVFQSFMTDSILFSRFKVGHKRDLWLPNTSRFASVSNQILISSITLREILLGQRVWDARFLPFSMRRRIINFYRFKLHWASSNINYNNK